MLRVLKKIRNRTDGKSERCINGDSNIRAIDRFDGQMSYSVEFNPLVFTEVSICLLQLFQYYRLGNTDKTQMDTQRC